MPARTSVIVVNYNGGPDAAANLRRVSELLGGGWELVVVDNCSTDGSPDLMAREVPSARVILEPANRGYAAAVNRGLAEAEGDVLVVLNADVTPRPGALAAIADAVGANRQYALLGGVLILPDGTRSSNVARMLPRASEILREGLFLPPRRPPLSPDPGKAAGPAELGVVPVPAIGGAVMALHRETLAELGPMDAEYFLYNEDMEWCRRAARKGLSVGVVTAACFDHRGGGSTRLNEGPAFAARVLSDFQYFCEGEGVAPARVRRLWRVRLVFRSWLYRADALLGVIGGRSESGKRAAIYRILAGQLRMFRWSVAEGLQNGHPSRLFRFPGDAGTADDARPVVLQLIPNMEYGGAQRLVETLAAGPLSARYRFEVMCLTHAGEIGEELRARGVPVHVAGLTGWRRLADWRRAADFAALMEPDLVHSHLLPGDIAAHYGFRGRAPVLSTKHNVDPHFSRVVKAVERLVLRCVPVLAVSDAVSRAKSYLGPWGALPPVVQSPPAVGVAERPAPLFVEGEPVRLSVICRLHRQKRVDIFLRTAAELERRFPGRFTFRIVGDGSEMGSLRRLAAELGLTDTVDFAGAVSDVASELDASDIVLLLSDYEGLGLTILETLARGRVPVVRRVPGTDEALPAALSTCFVDSASPQDVAEKVLEVCGDRARFAELAREGHSWVAGRLDYSTVMGRVYEEMLPAARKRTRVLHLITRLIVGGAQENTVASVERVDPARFESQLWIGPQTGSEGSLIDDARSRGIVLRVLPNLVREINPRRDALAFFQLIRLLRRDRFDVIHTHSSKAGILGRAAARLAGVPHVVHTIHGWGFHDRMHPRLKALYVALEKMLQPGTSVLVSVSNKTTRIGLEEGIGEPSDYRLIRSGIPLSRFSPDRDRGAEIRSRLGLKADDIVVGSVGRLSPQKNPRDFVRVAGLLSRGRPNLRFVYVGDGPMRAEVEGAIESDGLSDRVLLLGVRDDVPDLLRAMDVFILTSLWEGLPRVVLQALATGVPVVAYDTAGIEEAVSEGANGYLVAPGDVDGMVSKLGALVDDPELRGRLSAAASGEFEASFTEDTMIRDLEDLYASLTEPPERRI
jgi:glycosyltransferase involved in cell wall biosynthesis/GT2 family glycosyltransferase